jgi:hypothetical protein
LIQHFNNNQTATELTTTNTTTNASNSTEKIGSVGDGNKEEYLSRSLGAELEKTVSTEMYSGSSDIDTFWIDINGGFIAWKGVICLTLLDYEKLAGVYHALIDNLGLFSFFIFLFIYFIILLFYFILFYFYIYIFFCVKFCF